MGSAAVAVTLSGLLLATLVPAAATADTPSTELEVIREADDEVAVLKVTVPSSDELNRLVATGVDLDHDIEQNDDGSYTVSAVVTGAQVTALETMGFSFGEVLYTQEDTEAALAERSAVQAEAREAVQSLQARSAAADVADIELLHAHYYTNFGTGYLSVEARFAGGQTNTGPIVISRDSGPGTEIGSGGTQNITRFVDASFYVKHRGASVVTTRPDKIQLTSPTGESIIVPVTDWLPITGDSVLESQPYETDFISSYLTPTELYQRIHALQAEFPAISEIVEMPYKTNGYRRPAQGILGAANANRVGVDSLAWGHEGGNGVVVSIADPGAADSPLSVSAVGSTVTVSAATGANGAITSTAAQVVAAINASPQAAASIKAYTYRGNAGAGVVTAGSVTLSDGLSAPASVSREPHSVYAIRIGAVRDGSKPGVLAYAQEHAREWVPPLVTIETAERLLRNYTHNGKVRELVNNLDIWIMPSMNPDGGHYSFYDFASQRRNMTNRCPETGNSDFSARNTWGTDLNRNYSEYSVFDGYAGASTSCTSDTFAGISEMSEPETQNVDWIAESNPNLRFAMNIHSSGNYFMWAPGAYKLPERELAPAPSAEDEAYFWSSSSRILSEIKRYRGMSVTPARTGPIANTIYSAAGNSGDYFFYKHHVFAWAFEVGTQFQPPFASTNPNAASAHAESQEYANGIMELMRVALDLARTEDAVKPTVTLTAPTSPYNGNAQTLVLQAQDAATGIDVVVGNIYQNGSLVKSTQVKADGAASATNSIDLSTVVPGGLPAGDYSLRYNTRDLAGNLSATNTFAFTIKPIASTTTASVTAATVTFGAPGTVSVSVAGAQNVPTGQVVLSVAGAEVGSGSLSSGAATIALPAGLPVGAHTLTATYGADGFYQPSSGTVRLNVAKAGSVVDASVTPNPVKAAVAAKVSVHAESTTGVDGTGAVTVLVKRGVSTAATVTGTLDAAGNVVVTLPKLSAGAYSITVTHGATANTYAASKVLPLTVTT